ADLELRILLLLRIEQMQITCLFVNEFAAARADVDYWKFVIVRELADVLRLRVESVDVVLTVAVAAEIDDIANPIRVGIIAAAGRLRYLLDLMVLALIDQNPRMRAAAIVFPLTGAVSDRRVSDVFPIG